MNCTTYLIGTEQEFKSIKMRVWYPWTTCPKIVGCITDKQSKLLVYITVYNITTIQLSPCIVEGILEISTIPCESNNDIELNQKLAAINDFVNYFLTHSKHIDMSASNQSLQLSENYYLWIYPTYAASFHLDAKNPSNNIKACGNQLTIGMNLQQLMQLLNYDRVGKPKDFSSDLSWFKKWEQNPYPDTNIKLKFAYDYILSIFVKAHKLNQLHSIPPSYQPGNLNHAEIKNGWGVLPRMYLYHIFDLFTVAEQQNLIAEIKKQKSIYGDEIERFWTFFKDQKNHNDDLILRSGLLETSDLINGQPIFLFKYRSVKLKVRDIYEDDKKIIWKG